jgi:hypothetical protein
VGDFLRVCPLVHLGQLVLGEEGRVLVVLLRHLGILLQGVLHRLGTLLQGVLHRLGILLVVLPREVLPIQKGFLGVRFFFLVCLEDLLGLVLLLKIGLRRLH